MPRLRLLALLLLAASPRLGVAQAKPSAPKPDPRVERLETEALREIDGMSVLTQQMVDQIFSFGELGFQEIETSRYLTDVLEKNGFTIRRGIAGIPTAWVATWGSGKPVLALGSDIDGIPQASQKPGVAYREPLLPGAPGHGEGHNSGQAVNVTAAIAVKKIMERDKLPGTIMLWPGVAEEQLGTKAYFVRDGLFKDVDVAMFTHVNSTFSTQWGLVGQYNSLVSAEFTFRGVAAHAAGAPWRGRSALDAVELMNIGWNYHREHMRLQQRSHYVIRDGGDQPNVVPSTSTVWYFFRETDFPRTQEMFATAQDVAKGAALMSGTQLDRVRILGSAWTPHFNKPVATALYENIKRVGMPRWSADDQTLARAVQKETGQTEKGLDTAVALLGSPMNEDDRKGGGSDDIGDVSWSVPTIQLYFPSNIPDTPGHSWIDAIAMATPIAHKGATAGAKAQALTMLDLMLTPSLVSAAHDYFTNVQTKDVKYQPFIRAQDTPAVELNANIMARFRPEMRKYYYDPTRFKTYLEQLGIKYPTVR